MLHNQFGLETNKSMMALAMSAKLTLNIYIHTCLKKHGMEGV